MDYILRGHHQLGAHLKALRKTRGISQTELGELLGVGQVRIANIEKNPGSVSVEQLVKILQLLDAQLVIRLESDKSKESEKNNSSIDW